MSLATDSIYRNKFEKVNATQYTCINAHSYKVLIHPSLMMTQGWAESTWKITNIG